MDSGQRPVTSSMQVWTAAAAVAGRDVEVWPVLVQTAVNIDKDNSNDNASTNILTAGNYRYDDEELTGELQYQVDNNGHNDSNSQAVQSTKDFQRDNKFTGEFGFTIRQNVLQSA